MVLQNLNIQGLYEDTCLEGVYWNWLCDQQVKSIHDLPLYIWWGLWLTKNKVIFDTKQAPILKAVTFIMGAFREHAQTKEKKRERLLKAP